jgi:pyruvate dehydrogenase (quinone)
MQMNGNNELLTVAKYWKHWKDPRWIVLVLNNRDLNMVTWEERVLAGNPKFKSSQELLDFPFARYADMLGLKGIRLDRADNIVSALEEALHADRPVVIDAYTDPEVPPLPPHITLTQARKFAGSMLDGDPNAAHAMRQSFKDWVQKFLH